MTEEEEFVLALLMNGHCDPAAYGQYPANYLVQLDRYFGHPYKTNKFICWLTHIRRDDNET